MRGGGVPSPLRKGSGEGAVPPPQKNLDYLTLKCCILYRVCQSSVTHDLSVISLTNEIVIIRLAANTINNDEMQQA